MNQNVKNQLGELAESLNLKEITGNIIDTAKSLVKTALRLLSCIPFIYIIFVMLLTISQRGIHWTSIFLIAASVLYLRHAVKKLRRKAKRQKFVRNIIPAGLGTKTNNNSKPSRPIGLVAPMATKQLKNKDTSYKTIRGPGGVEIKIPL